MTKILYYKYSITRNDTKIENSENYIIELINSIMIFNPILNERERSINNNGKMERILLNRVDTPQQNDIKLVIDNNIKILTFSRKRHRNPYISEDGSDIYEQIPTNRKVLELATAVIIPNKNLLLLQRNIHSVSINLIRKYLCEFLPDDLNIEFEPITIPSNLGEVLQANFISKIEFKFDTYLLRQTVGNLNNDNVFFSAISSQCEVARLTNSPETVITFKNGKISRSLNTIEALNFINFVLSLNNNDDSPLKTIKVKYKTQTIFKLKEVDLATDGQKNFELNLTDNGAEYIGNNIIREYYNSPDNRVN